MTSKNNLPPLDEISDEELLEAATLFDQADSGEQNDDGNEWELLFETKDFHEYEQMGPEARRDDRQDRFRMTRTKEKNSVFNMYVYQLDGHCMLLLR